MKKVTVYLAVFCLLSFSSSSFAGGAISVQWGNDSKPGCDDCDSKYKKKGGPPPHAPAHGFRAKHQYRYYPNCNVYHDRSRNMFFYMKGDGWAAGASLPTSLESSLGVSVNLDMDTDKPYEHNAQHVKEYPKEKYKPGKVAKK